MSRRSIVRQLIATFAAALLAQAASAQQVSGTLAANGNSVELKHVMAQEIDSTTEKGFMDVVVVLSDRKLAPADARNVERLEGMARKEGLVALVVRLNPDAKVLSAEPIHPAFTTFVSSAAFIRWKPSAYDEKRVTGRFWTDGTQSEFKQRWSFDATFSVPITLDPAAQTAPKK